ncbi:MAG: hypothetical protein ACR2QO_16115 [Acidimicrobiales bacterium]
MTVASLGMEANGGPRPDRTRLLIVGLLGAVAVLLVALLVVLLAGDDDSGEEAGTATTTSTSLASADASTTPPRAGVTTTTESAATDPPSTTPQPVSGPAGPTCRDGWTKPEPGTALRTEPLDVIRAALETSTVFVVDEMRYFTGPGERAIIEPRPEIVHYWYAVVPAVDDPNVTGRFLVIRPDNRNGAILALAPYDTTGLGPGDWVTFVGESDEAHEYEGIPGSWFGIPIDFVTGTVLGSDDLLEEPLFGLPDEVLGCLEGI